MARPTKITVSSIPKPPPPHHPLNKTRRPHQQLPTKPHHQHTDDGGEDGHTGGGVVVRGLATRLAQAGLGQEDDELLSGPEGERLRRMSGAVRTLLEVRVCM
jgi:hypothetical protein